MQNKNLAGLMPVIHLRWYFNNFVIDCRNIDAVVVVDETPSMAAKVAMSDGRTKVAFLAVSAIRQENLSSAVSGALQHTITVRYMFQDDQVENGITGAHWDTQEHWLLRSLLLWVGDSDQGHQCIRLLLVPYSVSFNFSKNRRNPESVILPKALAFQIPKSFDRSLI